MALINAVLDTAVYQPVTNGFYRAICIRDAPAQEVAAKMVELYEINPDEPRVRELLKAWSELAPTNAPAQRRLVDGVFIPAAQLNELTVFSCLLDNLGLLGRTSEAKRAQARDALRASAEKLERGEELETRLAEEGFKKSGGLLRSEKDV